MRFLLAKDLLILRRSPLLVSLLIVYPVIVALLIGISLSGGPQKPTVAFLNEISTTQKLDIGGNKFNLGLAKKELENRVNVLNVKSREKDERLVRDGDALGALIIPKDAGVKLESTVEQPTVEVIVNEEDPLKARLVDDTISSVLADANQRVSEALTKTTIDYLNVVLTGGTVDILGRNFDVLGLRGVGQVVEKMRKKVPNNSKEAKQLDDVIHFNTLAQQNFGLVNKALVSISQPIKVDKTVLKGSSVPLTTFAAAIAAAISLMFVTVMLASAALALERDENTFGRLVRGPITKNGLLAEKITLAVCGSVVVVLMMLAALSFFISVDWGRSPLWLLALIVSAVAFAAFGTTIGSIARDVSTASLLAFTLLMPVAFLALVPSGVVSAPLYDLTRVISALFPFKPTVSAMNASLYGNGSLLGPLAHLVGLAAAYAVAARLSLRRFA